jgi:hypothetical protein
MQQNADDSPCKPPPSRKECVSGLAGWQEKKATADRHGLVCLESLKVDLNRKLHIEGFTRTDSRRAVEVADSIAYETESTEVRAINRCTDATSRIRRAATSRNRSGSGRQVDAIEEIKQIRPELNFKALADWNVLDDGQVQVSIAGGVELVAGYVAEGCSRYNRAGGAGPDSSRAESCRIKPLRASASCRDAV